MDYLRRLIDNSIIAEETFDIVEDKRDGPSHGIV